MSDDRRPSASRGGGCLTPLLVVLGVLLLLPGMLCAMIPGPGSSGSNPITQAVSLLALGGGVLIVWAVVRKSRS